VGRFLHVLFYSFVLSPLPFFHAPNTVHAAQTPIIGEVMWAGSSLSSVDEWLELWNNSDEPIALAGYILRGASASDIVLNETHMIPARSAFLIANYAHDDEKSAVATSVQLVTTAISLSNSALKIELVAPDETIIDMVGDGSLPPAGSSLPTKTSMIRQVDGAWVNATTSINLDPVVTDWATPGFCDGCLAVSPAAPDGSPVESTGTESETTTSTEPVLEPIIEPDPELPIIEIPTSTEPVIEQVTSTEPIPEITSLTEPLAPALASAVPLLEPLAGTSSTIETITTSTEPVIETLNSTIELPIQQPAPVVAPTPAPPAPIPTPTPTPAPAVVLHLHAISPAPESGDEWIELRIPNGTILAQADGWSLHDASASIFRFGSANDRITINGDIWHISLTSARLNNSGDTVELMRPDGSIAERMTFPETPRGTSWIKNTDNTAWIQDPPPAPPATPAPTAAPAPTPAPVVSATPPPPTIELPTIVATSTQVEAATDSPIKSATTTKPKTTKDTTVAKPKVTTTKKVTAKKTDPVPPLVTLDMFTQLEPEIRVTLEGTVGTLPGILSKNQFTLHTPDGRGLLVRGSSKQVSPKFGSKIRLTGTLSLNDDGLSLKMLTKDKWEKIDGTESIESRVVDLLAPSQEDAWSLIQVTGTVLDTGSGRANLELGGVPITVKIRPVTGYRAERLSKGDLVRITGVVDTRSEEPLLYPRDASEIEIISHAKLASATGPSNNLPAWTPFGAAGITIAVTEGYKRLRRLAKDRKLKKLAALAQ
jgi:hypothetical protein